MVENRLRYAVDSLLRSNSFTKRKIFFCRNFKLHLHDKGSFAMQIIFSFWGLFVNYVMFVLKGGVQQLLLSKEKRLFIKDVCNFNLIQQIPHTFYLPLCFVASKVNPPSVDV